jgi:hypothetical protein
VPSVMVQAAVDSCGGGGVLICKFREAERENGKFRSYSFLLLFFYAFSFFF